MKAGPVLRIANVHPRPPAYGIDLPENAFRIDAVLFDIMHLKEPSGSHITGCQAQTVKTSCGAMRPSIETILDAVVPKPQ